MQIYELPQDDPVDVRLMQYFARGDVAFGSAPMVNGLFTRCWVWKGKRVSRNGYGRVRCCDGKERAAHRVIYELIKGLIPTGLILDHRCRNRACVNPNHMEPVTHRENTLRGHAVLFKKPEDYANTIAVPESSGSWRACTLVRKAPDMVIATKLGDGLCKTGRLSAEELSAYDRDHPWDLRPHPDFLHSNHHLPKWPYWFFVGVIIVTVLGFAFCHW